MSMSTTALQIHDNQGEEAMLAYLLFAKAHTADKRLWEPVLSHCVLRDGTSVRRIYRPTPGIDGDRLYHFQWQDIDGTRKWDERPATIAGNPALPEPLITLVEWPHTDSIQVEVMEYARKEASRRLGVNIKEANHNDVQTLATMHILAPKAREAVNNAILQDRQPDSITAELQALQEEYAQDAIDLMPPDQFEALVQQAARELQAG